MLEQKYRHMMDQISPDEKLVEQALENVWNQEGRKGRKVWYPAVAAAACVCLFLVAMPVLAAVPQGYQFLYLVSPATAQFFKPVRRACEDQGIRMEVESACIHGDTAEFYVTMQDLEGDRIDGTTDLYDSYSIHMPFDGIGHSERIGYDEETGKVSFYVSLTRWDQGKIEGGKITFSVREFLSHKKKWEALLIDDLKKQERTKEQPARLTESYGGGGLDHELYLEKDGQTGVLVPGKPWEGFCVEGAELTGMGYVDGLFHVQVAYLNRYETDIHGFLYLQDEQGQTVDDIYNVYHAESEETRGERDYVDYVFDVPPEKLGKYRLYGDFSTSGMHVEGNWQVTFPLEE